MICLFARIYTQTRFSDELPFFAQSRPRRMIRLQYKLGQSDLLFGLKLYALICSW